MKFIKFCKTLFKNLSTLYFWEKFFKLGQIFNNLIKINKSFKKILRNFKKF